jgi:hypothetical protein
MEESPVKFAIRRTLAGLVWFGLLFGRQTSADDSWGQNLPKAAIGGTTADSNVSGGTISGGSASGGGLRDTVTPRMDSRGEVVSPGSVINGAGGDYRAEPDSVVGEHQPPIGGLFSDTVPGVCEWCGGGNCLPPKWSVESSLAVMAMSRPADVRLGANSLGAGPLFAGNISVTSTAGITTSNSFSQYLNDALQFSALETHTPSITDSPSWNITVNRFLGRDAEGRDHFLEFDFNGLQSYSSQVVVHGSIIPFYSTTPFVQNIPAPPPVDLYFQGSLVSPFPIFLPDNGQQQQLLVPSFSILGENYDKAFNRADTMSTVYHSNFNEFELNYRFAGHNQPDQLVMNPNGHWYRQCQTGYYYSYFFGLKSIVIDEDSDFASSGSQFAAVAGPNGTYTQGALQYTHAGNYEVHTFNNLLGLQSGGKLEYRFCRWCLDTHGFAGMFMNFASQSSRIQTSFGGPTPPTLSDGSTAVDTDNSFGCSATDVAFAGGFGVTGSYKFLPNLVGHISYDMLWVGDVARAPEQMIFSSVPETARTLINTQGSIFYDGVSAGVEWSW